VLNNLLNLQALLIIISSVFLLSKSSLVAKRTLVIDYCYFCKYNYFFLIENLEPSNDNNLSTKDDQKKYERKIEKEDIEDIIRSKTTRLRIRFNDILDRIENHRPYPFSDQMYPDTLAALIKDFDYNGVKFERERYVYIHDDTFPTKILKHAFMHARIALINKKYLNKLNT